MGKIAMLKAQKLFVSSCLTIAFLLTGTESMAKDKPAPFSRAASKARPYPELKEGIERKSVTVWSDGTRMAADIYKPTGLTSEDKLPAIIIVNGTGGEKRKLPTRLAHYFVQKGYVFMAFDYRGWGESDSKLMMVEEMPEPDAEGMVTVKARALRWTMDYADQVLDVRNCISFLQGEPNVDPDKIGLFGTSFGGGLSTYVAATDYRVKALVIQVAGMGRMRSHGAAVNANKMATKQARGEIAPVPYQVHKHGDKIKRYGQMNSNLPKWVGYNPLDHAHKIKAPTLIVDAGADELLNYKRNGKAVADILKKTDTPVKHYVIEEMKHYGVYRQYLEQIIGEEVAWFDKHLKGKQ